MTSATALTANISIGPGVPVGSYAVTVRTNGEVVTLANAFSVTAATPYLSQVSPNSGVQGQPQTVAITGVFTSFTSGTISANFGPNITVDSVTPNTDLSATAKITIAATAAAGGRTATLTSDGKDYDFAFTVLSSSAALTSVTPHSGLQGSSVALQVTGVNTHWVQGLTFASLGGGITINRVVVDSPTAAEVDITIADNASVGARGVTMSTGGEAASLGNAFTVLPYTPTLTLSPTSGMIAVAPQATNIVNVTFHGNFTHFVKDQTIATIDGNGAVLQNFTVLTGYTATAQLAISQTAPSWPGVTDISESTLCTNQYGGNRIVTLETPLTSGSEIVKAGFCVTSTPAVLTSISPYHSGGACQQSDGHNQRRPHAFCAGRDDSGFWSQCHRGGG